MTYYNLIKLAKSHDESGHSSNVILPASAAAGTGSIIGYRHLVGKAREMEDTIENLKSSIPSPNPANRTFLEDTEKMLSNHSGKAEALEKGYQQFQDDMSEFRKGKTLPYQYKNDPGYYKSTAEFFEKAKKDLKDEGDLLLGAKNKALSAIKEHDDEVTSIKNKIESAKKTQGRTLLKGRALGLLGAGLVGGGLIHAMSRPRERK